jgi:hypothetical protein
MAPGAGLRSHVLGEQQTRTGRDRSVAVPLRRNERYEQGNGMGKDQKYPLSTCTNADPHGRSKIVFAVLNHDSWRVLRCDHERRAGQGKVTKLR